MSIGLPHNIAGKIDIPTLYKLMLAQKQNSKLYGGHYELRFEDITDTYTDDTQQLALQAQEHNNNINHDFQDVGHADDVLNQQDYPPTSTPANYAVPQWWKHKRYEHTPTVIQRFNHSQARIRR